MNKKNHKMKKYFTLAVLIIAGFYFYACSQSDTGNASPVQDLDSNYFYNPVLQSGADPQVFAKDGWYYCMTTTGNLTLRRTRKMAELEHAETKVIWTPPETGMWSNSIWAPEIHFLQGKWYVYFAADDGDNANLRMYVVENATGDPFQGKWVLKGQLKPATDRWAIDGSVFEDNGNLYFIWSGMAGKEENVAQNIYIAQMENPWTIKGDRVLISTPEFDWESKGASTSEPKVNECPIMLKGIVKLFITYSASGCWTDDYCLGMLTANAGADLLNPESWTKSKEPVLQKCVENMVFAPGHNGFFKSSDGKEDWIIFHANDHPGDGCGGSRKPHIQKITWRADGTPDFGIPVLNRTPVKKPSGE